MKNIKKIVTILLVALFALSSVTALAEGRANCIIATQEGGIVEIPIEEALQRTKKLQMDRYRIMETMQVGGLREHAE